MGQGVSDNEKSKDQLPMVVYSAVIAMPCDDHRVRTRRKSAWDNQLVG